MALRTLTFDESLRTNDRELTKRNASPEISFTQLEVMRSGERCTIERLLQDREKIERLRSTDNQREAYGREQWDREFVLLREMQDHPDSAYEGEKLQRKIWDALPNSRFKRFQLLFSRREDFVVPRFEIDAKGVIAFPDSLDFDALSLVPCLVSPDRISDDFAQHLHLCEFTEQDRRRPLQRLERKHDEAIPALKKLWESLTPLQLKARRWFQISPSTKDVRQRYEDVPGPHPDTFGTLLYVRECSTLDDAPIPLVAQHFTSVYDASRKPIHQYENYGKEISTLAMLEEDVRALNGRLNTEWKDPDNRELLRRQCAEVMQECIDCLETCVNRYKVQVHDLSTQVQSLKDSLGRENIAANMAQLVAIINRFLKRYAEIREKGGRNEQDRLSLQQNIAENEHILASFLRSVQRSADILGQRKIALFHQEETNSRQESDRSLDGQANGLLRRMAIDPSPLERITLQPMRFYSEHLRDGYRDLETACLAGDREWAEHSLIRMHVLGKFQLVRSNLERLKTRIIVEDSLPRSRERVVQMLNSLQQYFSELQIFPENIVEEFRCPFEELHRRITDVIAYLDSVEGQDLNADTRKGLKRELDAIDVEEIAMPLT